MNSRPFSWRVVAIAAATALWLSPGLASDPDTTRAENPSSCPARSQITEGTATPAAIPPCSMLRADPVRTGAGDNGTHLALARDEQSVPLKPVLFANAASQILAQNAPAPGGAPPQAPQAGPGEFEVSDEAAQRALERALVQTGAALLPPFKFELIPSLTYTFHGQSLPSQIALTSTGTILITETVTRNSVVEAGGLVRVGLPFDFQAELGLPFDYKSIEAASRVNGAGLNEVSADAVGIGDLSLSLTHQVLVEGDVRPGLFIGVGWNSNFGQVKNHIPLGTGFHELNLGITAVKRQDPLVFTAGFSYQNSLENNAFKPGDQFTPSVGMLLAVSPETSLRFSQQLTFALRDEFQSHPVPGSEKTIGIFSFGLLSILGRGFVVNLTGGIGETRDAPDFIFQVAFPIRLN